MPARHLQVSEICAGFWRQNDWGKTDRELLEFVEQLLELGITTMDHAAVYQSEEQFGRVISQSPGIREKMEIVTKWGIRPAGMPGIGADKTSHYDNSIAHLKTSLDQSLRLLQTDYVDVLLIHRPDYLMRVDAMAAAFEQLKSSGKVRAIGVSNFSPSQFEALQTFCGFPLVTNQIEFSPLHLNPLDDGSFDQCQKYAINPMVWSCLAGGRVFNGDDERAIRVRKALMQLANELDISDVESLVYAWIMALPCKPLPISGTGNIDRARAAAGAMDIQLTPEQWYRIWEASTGHPAP
jgi:predicted oxidoreductase